MAVLFFWHHVMFVTIPTYSPAWDDISRYLIQYLAGFSTEEEYFLGIYVITLILKAGLYSLANFFYVHERILLKGIVRSK